MPRRVLTLMTCGLAAAAMLGPAAARASGTSPAGTAGTSATIRLRGIDRLGNKLPMSFATAFPLDKDAARPDYEANSRGVLHLPSGKYLVGFDIVTFSADPSQASSTLGATIVRSAGHAKTVTMDARRGKLVQVALKVPGAAETRSDEAICGVGGQEPGDHSLPVASAVAGGGDQLYAIPSRSSFVQFGVSSAWTGPDGSQYLLARAKAGIPAQARFTFRPSDLGALVLRTAAGATPGSAGATSLEPGAACGALDGVEGSSLPIPQQVTFQVSPGRWLADFAWTDRGDDDTGLVQTVAAGHRYIRTFGRAVRGPGKGVLPFYDSALGDHHNFFFSTLSFYHDAAANGDECCSQGTIALRARGKLVKKTSFVGTGRPFLADVRRPGRYTIDISATRQPPGKGVTPAILSTRLHLTWKFKATAQDLGETIVGVPVSVTTFRPARLDLRNEARPGAVTQVSVIIEAARTDHQHAVKSVRVQASYDDGASWHTVPVSGRGTRRLASVQDPASGFVSLRSTVTDVQGNSTVETIVRAYAIS